MGRIAEALKKAEQQRRQRPAVTEPEASAGQPPGPPLPAESEQNEDTTVASVTSRSAERPPPVEGMAEALVAYYDPSSVIGEQYRGLRTRLLSQNPDNEHRIIAITSAIPRDGKSVTTLNTALIMAEIGHLRILVVDGDFRRSSLAKLLNLPSSPGLADMLRGEADYGQIIQQTQLPNLFFVAAGETKGHSAAELLSVESAGSILAAFRNQFHYTLVDTPPATTVTDVAIIGPWCDGVIVVVRLNQTPDPIAQRAVRTLQVNNIPIIGAVLVGNERRTPGYGYYRYYKYYRYYRSSHKDAVR